MGQMTGEGANTFLPALDVAHGNNIQRISTSQQINSEFHKITTGSYFDVSSPMVNLVAQELTTNAKGQHHHSDLWQANHIHMITRAEDLLSLMGFDSQRYNIDELYETSGNASYVAGNHEIYSDYQWTQIGQHYPNNPYKSESEPVPPQGENECRLHPYRTRLTGPFGSSYTYTVNDWWLKTAEGSFHLDICDYATIRTRFMPITLYASKQCSFDESFKCNPDKPEDCIGEVRIGAMEEIFLHAEEKDICLWAEDRDIHIKAEEHQRRYSGEDTSEFVGREYHHLTIKDAMRTALNHHIRAVQTVYIDGALVMINSGRSEVAKFYDPREVPVTAEPLPLESRIYKQMTDVKPLEKEGLAGPQPQNQARPQSPEASVLYADHPDAGKHTHIVGGSPDMREEVPGFIPGEG